VPALPEFVEPMLAKPGPPFDSDEHLFEIKWDGTRALAFVEAGGLRVRNRKAKDLLPVYPELEVLSGLPPGCVLDGEVVVLRGGKPDFHGMLRREQARGGRRARAAMRALPATYVVFDLLWRDGRPLLDAPLSTRRAALAELVGAAAEEKVVLSEGVVGAGLRFFEEIERLELEGMVAKRLASRYLPGQRTDAWTKVKQARRLLCAIVGYLLDDDGGLKSLIVAAEDGGELRCVGRVGSGLGEALRTRLLALCRARPRAAPIVDCGMPGEWVEPGLFCAVSYLERTPTGFLRAPVFLELLDEPR